ncbi:MAG: flagellar motor switch protein FliM [Deltaproteobacteria bacterium]|nr:flagellar motor switch protein FliM [Deltaproteobacteria bacterium]
MSQVLSQEEVDALLKGVSDGEIETEQEEAHDPSEIRPYDLTGQDRVIDQRMPTLEMATEKFTRIFRSTLSSLLKKIVTTSGVSVSVVKYANFIKTIPVPASLHVFQMKPLGGSSLLVIEPQVAFTLVDLIFGGSGRETFKVEGRDFTLIENNLIKRVALNALSDFEKVWEAIIEIDIVYQRSETNPQFVQLVTPDEIVVIMQFELDMGFSSGEMTFCIPYSTIEPIRDKLHVTYQTEVLEVDKKWVGKFAERLKTSQVTLSVELGQAKLSGREVVNLKRGDVIPLERHYRDNLDVYVEDVLKFKGQPGSYKGNQAVEIFELIDKKGVYEHGTE